MGLEVGEAGSGFRSALRRSKTYHALRDPAWTFSRRGQNNRERLRRLHNSQQGAHGFIVGTGPSLQKVDFEPLRAGPSIGLNRLFLGFERFDFVPDFLVCVNLLMLEQSGPMLSDLPCPLVASWAGRNNLPERDNQVLLRTLAGVGFSKTLMHSVYTGGTVTHVALQLAYWLGWERITLIGIDHNYVLNGPEKSIGPHGTARRTGPDLNHFQSDYMDDGTTWQVPDLRQSEEAYTLARRVFENSGRRVVDGTVGGNLDVFQRAEVSYGKPAGHGDVTEAHSS